jgi:hypothetical protein
VRCSYISSVVYNCSFCVIVSPDGVIFPQFGSLETHCANLSFVSFPVLCNNRSLSTHRHSALKVVKSAGRYAETARDEIKLLSRVSSISPLHPGRDHIVSFLDSFSHQGPESSHVCIVFEPLGENLLALIERHKKKGVPRVLVRVIARQILLGLEYLHDECDLVHTDIKPENICQSIRFFPSSFPYHEIPPDSFSFFLILTQVLNGTDPFL